MHQILGFFSSLPLIMWLNLFQCSAGNIPEQFIDAQCPGLVANIRGKLKFLKDAFKEAVDQVSWALQRILSSQLPDCCVQSWLQALVLHLDLKSDLLVRLS